MALALIKKPRGIHPLSIKIAKTLQTLDNSDKIRFCHVKAHTDNVGNERADKLAKIVARTRKEIVFNQLPASYICRNIKNNTLANWQRQWDSSPKGRLTYEFLPNINERLKKTFICPNFHVTQVLTGHGNLRSYLYRFKIINSDSCDCDKDSPQTVQHFIFNCKKFEKEREVLIKHALYNNQNWPCQLEFFTKNTENFKKLNAFITATGATINEWSADPFSS